MAGLCKVAGLLALLILAYVCNEVHSIQNHPTHYRSSQNEPSVPGGPSVRSRTTNDELLLERYYSGGTQNLQRTQDAPRLESSKSFFDGLELDGEETVRAPAKSSFKDDVATSSADEPVDALTSSKLIDQIDGNQIEVKPGEYYYKNIVPTKSESLSGEARGAPREGPASPRSEPRDQQLRASQLSSMPRQARREPATIYSEHAPPPVLGSQLPAANGPRQANPDIQDIITGIVKLLNGKVNVAVSSAKPVRPAQSTRINNRGPPRISDSPPIPPDFGTPGMNPPPPATFERPPAPSAPSVDQLPPELPITPFLSGIPLPEAIAPLVNRPWRPGTRRPVQPSFKPLPAVNVTALLDREQSEPNELGNKIEQDDKRTRATESPAPYKYPTDLANHSQQDSKESRPPVSPTRRYQSTLKTDNAIAENTLVLGGLAPLPQPIPSNPPEPLEAGNGKKKSNKVSSTSSKPVFQTTLNVETSSSVQVIATTSTTTMLEPSVHPVVHTDFAQSASPATTTTTTAPPSLTSLEPSRSSTPVVDPSSSLSTPTEGLTTNVVRTSGLPSRTIQPITTSVTFSKGHSSVYSYRPRPGIVLDDTLDYANNHGAVSQRPHGPPRYPSNPDIFDVVVSAIHGPGQSGTGEVRVPINGAHGDDILTSPVGGQGFVSIDGKRTYLNLFDNTEAAGAGPSKPAGQVQPTRTQTAAVVGTGFAVPTEPNGVSPRPSVPYRRPTFQRRPTQPPVRIDTCIVGDSSTCDASQHEACATVQGVSACHCKPGFARLTHSLPCKIDKIYDKKMAWDKDLEDKDSELHQTLVYEANRAIESAMSMTPFSDEYVGSSVNNVYEGDVSQGQGGVFVNATLKLAYEARTARQSLAAELQKHLLGVIQRRYNNIGNSALYVDSPAGSISNLQDLDECASSELNDCHSSATCANTWGGFVCNCKPGLKDPHKSDPSTSGRTCLTCPATHCNNRGTCSYQGDQIQCSCTGNYYGAQCDIDGEVLGVSIGASVAALIIIILTLVGLVMWSRKWSREQKAISPVYGYVQGTLPGTLPARVGSVGTLASVKQGPPTTIPPYMWAQMADHLATANVYATEPMGPTRPSSAMFGYPTMSMHGTLPPVPLPRLQAPPRARQRHHQQEPDSSDSEPQDKDRADLIPQSSFQVPRPKSRSSLANQSGIYYDVEYDQGDARHLSKNNIPMSTYSMAPYYRT